MAVLNGGVELGEHVCLIDYDGHHRGTATAEFLANQGKKVHIITPSLFVGANWAEPGPLPGTARLLQKGGDLHPGHRGDGSRGRGGAKTVKGFNVYSNIWDQWGPFDSLVLAMDRR